MSSTIAIPAGRTSQNYGESSKAGSSSSSSSYSTSPQTPALSKATPSTQSASRLYLHQRRPSLLSMPHQQYGFPSSSDTNISPPGTAFCEDECTVINIGDPDGPPRLVSPCSISRLKVATDNGHQISYLSSSQGFAWNPEIFLPSYIDCEYVPLENRREPVHEIRLSDAEAKKMLP